MWLAVNSVQPVAMYSSSLSIKVKGNIHEIQVHGYVNSRARLLTVYYFKCIHNVLHTIL